MAEGSDLGKSSTGLDANVAGMLAYIGSLVTGIVFFLIEKDNKFVKFHAMQSILLSAALFVLLVVLVVVPVLIPLVNLAGLVLWILCMVQAFQGKWFKLPVIGDIAAKQAGV